MDRSIKKFFKDKEFKRCRFFCQSFNPVVDTFTTVINTEVDFSTKSELDKNSKLIQFCNKYKLQCCCNGDKSKCLKK